MTTELPIVEPFRVPALGLDFVDRRLATDAEWATARDVLTEVTMREWSADRGRRGWCDENPSTIARLHAAYETARASDPDLSYDEWKARGGAVEADPWYYDPRLQTIRFIARERQGGEPRGALIFQNVKQLDETGGVVSIGFLPLMGVRTRARMSVPQTWGLLGRVILSDDLALRDGRSLRVAEVEFPQSADTDFRASSDDVDDMWSRIADLTDDDVRGDAAPGRIRRKPRGGPSPSGGG